MQLSDLPAKSDGTTVTEHTEHVVIAAEELLKRLPITNEERLSWHQIIRECAVLHDVGKIHPYFQANLNAETTIFPIRHEIVSLWIISAYIEEVSDIQAFAIATHHKGIMDSLSPFKSRLSQDIQNDLSEQIALNDFQKIIPYIPELLNKWIEKFNVFIKLKLVPELEANIIQPQLWQLLKKNFQPKQLPSLRKQLAETRGLLIASDHIGSAKEHNNIPKPPIITFDTFVPRDNEGNVLPFREFQADLQQVNGDVLLYAPTGSGKTEAALNWLVNNQELNARFFYLLPYTASINAMVKRLEKIFGKEQVTALHSKTLDFFYERLENEEWDDTSESKTARHARNAAKAKSMKHLSREIFYPAKVATPHQILKNALMGKGWEMSLFDYRKACFVIDEFHAYEPLLTGLLLATLHWLKKHFEARIFFMSATIPSFLKELIIKEVFKGDTSVYREPINDANRPLDQVILDQKRHRVICHDNKSVDASLSIIKGLLAEGKSVLVIVNNVKTCQDIFEKTDFDGFKQMLHGGFNREDRVKIENNITNEDITKRPQLLVATQAIEVSLDIDYDLAFIENAPIDALIQRLGRVNRKGLKGIVSIHLFEKIIGNTPFYSKMF